MRHYLNERLLQFSGYVGYEIRPSKRRGYGKLILKLGLEQVRILGIPRVLIICDDDIGSAKIIEANGGILENIVLLSHHPVATRRYWVDVPLTTTIG